MEPGVTVWGRAGSRVGTAQVMHLPLPNLPTVCEGGALDPGCPGDRERSGGLRLGGRRDAGLVGASLSADVPLARKVEHMFYFVKIAFDLCSGATGSIADPSHFAEPLASPFRLVSCRSAEVAEIVLCG